MRSLLRLITALAALGGASADERLIWSDPFDETSAWLSAPADGVRLELAADVGVAGSALRLDFDFQGHAGYAIARRVVAIELPENYAFSFRIRGEAPSNNLEFKLVDPSGENVWWVNQREFVFASEWTTVVLPKRRIQFAWGPTKQEKPSRVAAIEFAITAGSGGRGSVWLDELQLIELAPERPYAGSPTVTSIPASETAPRAIDGRLDTVWTAEWRSSAPIELALDFGVVRSLGGLVLSWGEERASDYDIELSIDGVEWSLARRVIGGEGPRDWIRLPETDTRMLRLSFRAGPARTLALREVEVRPLEFGESDNSLFSALAAASSRGSFPRYWLGEQVYWTVVGVAGGRSNSLLSEDGAIELGAGGPILEPFVEWDGSRTGWAGVTRSVSLADRRLPIPSVVWSADGFTLEITALADGAPEHPLIHLRYKLTNRSSVAKRAKLVVALRPMQVNPPWQFLGTPGGAARIDRIAVVRGGWEVSGPGRNRRRVRFSVPPDSLHAARFAAGDVVLRWLEGRSLPSASSVDDPIALPSAIALWETETIAPDKSWSVALTIGAGEESAVSQTAFTSAPLHSFEQRLLRAQRHWSEQLGRVSFRVPAEARPLIETLHANLAYTLITKVGPGLQPGPRAYARSWIRDGTLASSALLRLGHEAEAREFARWFAGYQYADGKVPCCVDRRGADPVPENDSHGQLIHLIAEVGRVTSDREFLVAMWPHVAAAVDYIDHLRAQRRTEAYKAEPNRVFFGLLPESISHEGYSDKPRHSYWDDFFALRGLDDAVSLAAQLGRGEEQRRYAQIRDQFRQDLFASIGIAMEQHRIDYIPGCAELGDFDPTSTTVALDPAGLLDSPLDGPLRRTFERFYDNFVKRRDGAVSWINYTPYELRSVGAFVRLGWTSRAQELLTFYLRDRRPLEWKAWAEVVWADSKTPKFIGDIPHTWVATDAIRGVLDLFAYERRSDQSLVIAAGVPLAWVVAPGGVAISRLRTPWGLLSWSARGSDNDLEFKLGRGLQIPPGGIVVPSPLETPRKVTVNGKPVTLDRRSELVIRALPARIRIQR